MGTWVGVGPCLTHPDVCCSLSRFIETVKCGEKLSRFSGWPLASLPSAAQCRSWVSRKMPRGAQGLPREDVPIAKPSHWLYWRSWPSPRLLSAFLCEISHLGDTASRFPFSFYVPWFSLLNKPEMFLRLIKTTGEVLFYSIIWKTASQQDRGVCGGLIRFLPHTSLKKFSET